MSDELNPYAAPSVEGDDPADDLPARLVHEEGLARAIRGFVVYRLLGELGTVSLLLDRFAKVQQLGAEIVVTCGGAVVGLGLAATAHQGLLGLRRDTPAVFGRWLVFDIARSVALLFLVSRLRAWSAVGAVVHVGVLAYAWYFVSWGAGRALFRADYRQRIAADPGARIKTVVPLTVLMIGLELAPRVAEYLLTKR